MLFCRMFRSSSSRCALSLLGFHVIVATVVLKALSMNKWKRLLSSGNCRCCRCWHATCRALNIFFKSLFCVTANCHLYTESRPPSVLRSPAICSICIKSREALRINSERPDCRGLNICVAKLIQFGAYLLRCGAKLSLSM